MQKHTFDGFFETELLDFLRRRHIDVVLTAGAETHVCMLRTAGSAVLNQISTIVLADCVWSHDRQLAEAALRMFEEAYGMIGNVYGDVDTECALSKIASKLGFAW